MEVERVLAREMRLEVEHHLLDRAGERKGLLALVAGVDDASVVTADVQSRVAGEPDRHGVVDAALRYGKVLDEESDLAARSRRGPVGRELHAHVHLARREIILRNLLEDE